MVARVSLTFLCPVIQQHCDCNVSCSDVTSDKILFKKKTHNIYERFCILQCTAKTGVLALETAVFNSCRIKNQLDVTCL